MPQSVEYMMNGRRCPYLKMMTPENSADVCEALKTYFANCEIARNNLIAKLDFIFKDFDPLIEKSQD
jgi:hypothetical protein